MFILKLILISLIIKIIYWICFELPAEKIEEEILEKRRRIGEKLELYGYDNPYLDD